MASRKKAKEPTKFYINRAKFIANEAEKMLQAVKRCLNESEGFPIYLDDLQIMVDNLVYLSVAHNAVLNEHYSNINKPKRSRRK
jgi:hypothetical protein